MVTKHDKPLTTMQKPAIIQRARTTDTIERRALMKNRRLRPGLSDDGVRAIWNSLDPATRQKYLDSLNA